MENKMLERPQEGRSPECGRESILFSILHERTGSPWLNLFKAWAATNCTDLSSPRMRGKGVVCSFFKTTQHLFNIFSIDSLYTVDYVLVPSWFCLFLEGLSLRMAGWPFTTHSPFFGLTVTLSQGKKKNMPD
jgi:hypothetical protein